MALIQCSECSKEISEKAPNCIHCGAPAENNEASIEKKDSAKYVDKAGNPRAPYDWELKEAGIKPPKSKKGILIAVGGVIGLLLLIGMAGSDESSSTLATSQPSAAKSSALFVSTSCPALVEEVSQNEARFVSKYKGKTIKVSGNVDSIDSTFGGVQISLSSGEEYDFNSCYVYPDKNADWPLSLNKGDRLTVTCSRVGETIGSVNLNKCKRN